jgi:hypothetical protein
MDIWSILWAFGVFYDHLVYFMDIWSILWTFGVFYGHLVYCCGLGITYQEKSVNPAIELGQGMVFLHKAQSLSLTPMQTKL